jgi:hypothetical protein
MLLKDNACSLPLSNGCCLQECIWDWWQEVLESRLKRNTLVADCKKNILKFVGFCTFTIAESNIYIWSVAAITGTDLDVPLWFKSTVSFWETYFWWSYCRKENYWFSNLYSHSVEQGKMLIVHMKISSSIWVTNLLRRSVVQEALLGSFHVDVAWFWAANYTLYTYYCSLPLRVTCCYNFFTSSVVFLPRTSCYIPWCANYLFSLFR